jgi:hypothetical protein
VSSRAQLQQRAVPAQSKGPRRWVPRLLPGRTHSRRVQA